MLTTEQKASKMNLQSDFYSKLKYDFIKMNWNKNPIKMDLFISFLEVKTDYEVNCTGWTTRRNSDIELIIRGGWVGSVEYLDSIQFGEKLQNKYNNYVNPFYIFDLLTKEGKLFFLDYYRVYIDDIISSQKISIEIANRELIKKEEILINYENEILLLNELTTQKNEPTTTS